MALALSNDIPKSIARMNLITPPSTLCTNTGALTPSRKYLGVNAVLASLAKNKPSKDWKHSLQFVKFCMNARKEYKSFTVSCDSPMITIFSVC
jgi:hypothetical protein